MVRFLIIVAAVALGLVVVSLVDALLSSAPEVRTLPKWVWVLIVLLVPIIGAVLWWAFGRPRALSARQAGRGADAPGTPHEATASERKLANTEFLRGLTPEQRISRIEQELKRLDDENFGKDDRSDS